jgi:predicted DNA binding CopG/RHH family protein
MLKEKKRKEVTLDVETLDLLSKQAELEGRKLKNYMEHVLKQKAEDFELSDDYKKMMDEMLERDKRGELNFSSWDEAKSRLKSRI